MTRTEQSIQDIASALCSVNPKLPNRHAVFVATLRGLIDAELERFSRDLVNGSREDFAKFEEILAKSKI